jgi:hypothetical protein
VRCWRGEPTGSIPTSLAARSGIRINGDTPAYSAAASSGTAWTLPRTAHTMRPSSSGSARANRQEITDARETGSADALLELWEESRRSRRGGAAQAARRAEEFAVTFRTSQRSTALFVTICKLGGLSVACPEDDRKQHNLPVELQRWHRFRG